MSLRIWTAGVAVAGLALYTLSFLPVTGYEPATVVSEPAPAQAELPGASMVPLNYVDPRESEFVPEFNFSDSLDSEVDSIAPIVPSTNPIRVRVRPIARVPEQQIQSLNSTEVWL